MENIKILIPTDFSVQAEFAYLLVKNMSIKINTEIHFLHILNVPDTVTLDSNSNIQTCGEIDVNYVKSQKDIIDRKLNNLKLLYGSHIHTHLLFGKTTSGIVDFAEQEKFDLIVMGTKGAWGLKEKISGTETQMIARKSTVPLLSLMCDRSDLVIKNILMVHNFNETSSENLTLLKKFIAAFDSKVHLLQIVSNQTEQQKADLNEKMNKYAADKGITNFENHFLVDTDVENGVIHFNQMHEIDMVCMGTHGKAGMFHTSATEKLINHLFKPLLSYHIKKINS